MSAKLELIDPSSEYRTRDEYVYQRTRLSDSDAAVVTLLVLFAGRLIGESTIGTSIDCHAVYLRGRSVVTEECVRWVPARS